VSVPRSTGPSSSAPFPAGMKTLVDEQKARADARGVSLVEQVEHEQRVRKIAAEVTAMIVAGPKQAALVVRPHAARRSPRSRSIRVRRARSPGRSTGGDDDPDDDVARLIRAEIGHARECPRCGDETIQDGLLRLCMGCEAETFLRLLERRS
jgi:hypothetical protein